MCVVSALPLCMVFTLTLNGRAACAHAFICILLTRTRARARARAVSSEGVFCLVAAARARCKSVFAHNAADDRLCRTNKSDMTECTGTRRCSQDIRLICTNRPNKQKRHQQTYRMLQICSDEGLTKADKQNTNKNWRDNLLTYRERNATIAAKSINNNREPVCVCVCLCCHRPRTHAPAPVLTPDQLSTNKIRTEMRACVRWRAIVNTGVSVCAFLHGII